MLLEVTVSWDEYSSSIDADRAVQSDLEDLALVVL